jgi:SrtB family sortase
MLIVIGLFGVVVAAYVLGVRQVNYAEARDLYAGLQQRYERPAAGATAGGETAGAGGSASLDEGIVGDATGVDAPGIVAEPPANVDLAGLQAQNSDCVGWIEVPNTAINYPVMQTGNSEEYLYKGFDGRQLYSGSIFMDFRCAADASSFNTVIYGHNMRDGSMFADLNFYLSPSFLQSHSTVYLHTTSGVHTYRVVTAKHTNVNDPVFQTIDPDATGQLAFYRELGNATLAYSADVHYLTLATCSDTQDHDARTIVLTVEVG